MTGVIAYHGINFESQLWDSTLGNNFGSHLWELTLDCGKEMSVLDNHGSTPPTALSDSLPVASKPVQLGLVASWFMVVFSLAGMVASAELLWSEIELISDPDVSLVCDVNLLIGCSDSLLSWQAHLLTLPNSLFGLAAFSMVAVLSVLQVAKVALPRWIWFALMAGTLVGVGLVIFFLIQALTSFRAICPFCALVWAVTLALFLIVWPSGLQSLRKPALAEVGQTLLRFSWALTLSSYLAIILVIALVLPDELAASF